MKTKHNHVRYSSKEKELLLNKDSCQECSEQATRTPGMWEVSKQNEIFVKGTATDIARCYGNGVHNAEANAAFIVKAVNLHDELVEGLDRIKSIIVEWSDGQDWADECEAIAEKLIQKSERGER